MHQSEHLTDELIPENLFISNRIWILEESSSSRHAINFNKIPKKLDQASNWNFGFKNFETRFKSMHQLHISILPHWGCLLLDFRKFHQRFERSTISLLLKNHWSSWANKIINWAMPLSIVHKSRCSLNLLLVPAIIRNILMKS